MRAQIAKREPTRGPRRRVFILGAGASASCGIPVAKDILREAIIQLTRVDRQRTNELHQLLKYLYANFDETIKNYPNVEDFLNLIEMAKTFNEEFMESTVWPKDRLERIRTITLKALTDYLWNKIGSEGETLAVIERFVRVRLKAGDVVITFNWDTTIERAVSSDPRPLEINYSYSAQPASDSVVLLKPHGSIDWFRKGDIPSGTPKENLISLDEQLCAYAHFDLSRDPRLRATQPVIVPPLTSKEFRFDFLKLTWRQVYRAVSRATALYIIGYSLPKEDQFARFVFRRAIRNNLIRASRGEKQSLDVVVVNPDENVEGTFSKLVGRLQRVHFMQAYFEDYTARVSGT